MAAIDLKKLVERLNDLCRRTLEAAAGLTVSRTHYNVEIEHWLVTLSDRADGDVAAILRHYGINLGQFAVDLNSALAKMSAGNDRAPSLSRDIVELVKQAWLLASLEQGATRLRSGHLLWALLADETLALRAQNVSGELLRIGPDMLKRDFAAITANSAESADESTIGLAEHLPVDRVDPVDGHSSERELDHRLTASLDRISDNLLRIEHQIAQLEVAQNEMATEARASAATAAGAVTAMHTSDLARQVGILQEQVRVLQAGDVIGRRSMGYQGDDALNA